MRVGFLGMGRMGAPMALNVLRAGFELAVWNRTPERCVPLAEAGATVGSSPAEAALGADVLVTMVADGPAAGAVLLGPEGALATLAPGAVAVEMSTIGPAWAVRLAEEAGTAGVGFLDAPVSGSIPAAESAQLVTMVGGDAATLERARPVLAAMTKAQLLLGGHGAGAAMKLAVNSAIALTAEAVSEALVLAEAAGIAREDAYAVLAAGAVASPFVQYKRAAFLDPDAEPVGFTLELMQKDVALALELARELGVPLPATAAAGQVLSIGRALGWGEGDLVRVADALRLNPAPGGGPVIE